MSRFCLLREAESDLDRILDWIERDSGRERADRMHARRMRAVRDLADYPRTGHLREDLTVKDVRVRSLDSYLIVYRPGTDPLEIVAFVHGARDPSELRDRIGEPVAVYADFGKE